MVFFKEYSNIDGMFIIIVITHLLLCTTRIIEGGDVSGNDNAASSEIGLPEHGS